MTLIKNIWNINYDKRHALKISSDYDAIDEHSDTVIVPPTNSLTENVNTFSEKLGQKLNKTKITTQDDGSEIVELELDDRIVTFIIDQSGSMSWNDINKKRYAIAQDIADKISSFMVSFSSISKRVRPSNSSPKPSMELMVAGISVSIALTPDTRKRPLLYGNLIANNGNAEQTIRAKYSLSSVKYPSSVLSGLIRLI